MLAVDVVVERMAWGDVAAIVESGATVGAVFDGCVVRTVGKGVFGVSNVVVGEVAFVVACGGGEATHMGVSEAGEEEAECWVCGDEVVGVIDGGMVDGREAL